MFFYNLLLAQGIPQFPPKFYKRKQGECNIKYGLLFTHVISFLWLMGQNAVPEFRVGQHATSEEFPVLY